MNKSILIFAQQLADELIRKERYGMARSYKNSVRCFLKYVGDSNMEFSDLNQSLLRCYEQYLFNIGRTRNTVSLYLRMLRSICNKAVERLKVTVPDNLFANLFLGMNQTERRTASLQVFARLSKLDLGNKPTSLGFARDLYMLSFYLRGIPFVDLANLCKDDIHEGVLYYRRRKTKRGLIVSLEPSAVRIIEKYSRYTANSPYLLPILDQDVESEYERYQNALRWYNRSLDGLSQMLKIECSLTSFVPRHSWAATAYRKGYPILMINGPLENASEHLAYNYLTSFGKKVLCQANKKATSNQDLSREKVSEESDMN